MEKLTDEHIITSWLKNAQPWIKAISNNEIQTRVELTNQAILDTVLSIKPTSVLDIGCGEGWLVRALTHSGIDSLGIDAVPALIDYANRQGSGRFMELAYEELGHSALHETFDLAVANFSLLGKESVEHVFKTVPTLLFPNGFFIVQTLHPETASGDHACQDGWREGSWDGFNKQFTDPAPWYFRTSESWQQLFTENGLKIDKKVAIFNPKTQFPASLILTGQKTD